MVSRRFRNRVNLSGDSSEAVASRIESLEESDVRIYRNDLVLVATQGDTYDRSVRIAAITKLDHVPSLTNLLEDAPDIAQAAADSIARLMVSNQEQVHQPLLESPEVRLAYIRASRDAERVQAMLDGLAEEQLVGLACKAAFSGVRRAAADRVMNESALAAIASDAKNHDKSVFRTARTRLARIRASRRTLEEADARAEDVARRLVELSEMPMDRTFTPRLKIIQQEWQECELARIHALESAPQLKVESPKLGAADSYSQALQRVEARVAHERLVHGDETQSAPPAPKQDVAPSRHATPSLDEETLGQIQSGVANLPPETPQPQSLEDYRKLWSDAQRFERTHRRLKRNLNALEQAADSAHLALKDQVESWLAAYKEHALRVQSIEEELLASFESQAKALAEQIELGHLGKASDLRHQCGDILRMLPEPRARRLWKRLGEIDSQIRRLRDWQAYAATPKRESLCEQMAEIAREPLPISDQVDRIRALREEWKAMGPLTGGRDHELRRRFERLADTAFAPCRAHFREQAELRKQNLATRRQICDDLEFFIREKDWDNPDWKAVERILRTARSEWRTAHPIDRAQTRPMQRRFDALCNDLFGRLSGQWKSNEVKARGLILELGALLESTSSVERRVEGTSAIQARWREVGPMSQSANRKLWKEFRGLCDKVYAERRAHRTQETEAYRDRITGARQLVQKLEEALEKSSIDTVSAGELTQFSEKWEAFKGLQGESFKRLENKWRDLSRRYRQMLREGDVARQLKHLELASRIDSSICDAEQALMDSGIRISESELEAILADIRTLFGKVLPTRFEHLREGIVIDEGEMQAHLAKRQRMCVTLDILLDRDSPPEDKALRLEIQVQRINRGAGAVLDQQEDPLEIAREWCRTGPVGHLAQEFNQRFFNTLKEMTQ